MKIALFTLTRDRIDFTRKCLDSLRTTRPGRNFDHFIYDQGSTDGTSQWLDSQLDEGRISGIVRFGQNVGISKGMNAAFSDLSESYDFIMSVDNDCMFRTKHWLRKLIKAYRTLERDKPCVISPRVLNLRHPPQPFARKRIGTFNFSFLEVIGGISRLMPKAITSEFRFNERLPLAFGQDQEIAKHCWLKGYPMAYVENVRVRHMMTDDEQDTSIPEYMRRKRYELYKPYGL